MQLIKIGVLVIFLFLLISAVSAADDYWIITCNVNGAEVYVDGVLTGEIQDHQLIIPYEGQVSPSLVVKATNYEEYWGKLEQPWPGIPFEKEVYLESQTIDDVEGKINIKCQQDYAEVWIQDDYPGKGDYRYVGTVPLTIYASTGWHRIIIWKNGYLSKSDRVLVVAGKYGNDYYYNLIEGNETRPFSIIETEIVTPIITETPTEITNATPATIATEIPTTPIDSSIENTEDDINYQHIVAIIAILIISAVGFLLVYNRSGTMAQE